jgi:hypothetical protein
MTELLEQAIAELKKLPVEQQNAIASRILVELKNETKTVLIDELSLTEAVVWSPQTDNAGVQALSDLLTAAQKETNA